MKIYVDKLPNSPENCLFSKETFIRDDWGNYIGNCMVCILNDHSDKVCNCKECKNLIALGEQV